ncbi:MAG: IS200/IS605 family transposase [Bacteroidales bacterium]
MTQSLSQLYVHLVFATKFRRPFIKREIKEKLISYLAGGLKNQNSPALIINAEPEHVHILFRLSKNHALAKVVEEIKKQSSKWVKTLDSTYANFAWQGGYAAFSVSSSAVNTVKRYIANQEEHHRKKSLKEEVETFVKEYDVIEYNPDFFWE